MRFGYPTISLQMEGVTSPWGEFLYKLTKGEATEFKTKKGFQICVVIGVPPFPFTDPAAFRRYSEDATIAMGAFVNPWTSSTAARIVTGSASNGYSSGATFATSGNGSGQPSGSAAIEFAGVT